jgi:glycosyltransferase involved in cell wall biosynthesis
MFYNFSLIIPCYNEEKNIKFLYKEFIKVPLKTEKAELVFVDNGSTDKTGLEINNVIRIHKNNNSNIKIRKIYLKKNRNYSGGVIEGLKQSKGEYIGWTHGDLQTPLKDFYKLYLKIKDKKRVLGKGRRIDRSFIDQLTTSLHEFFSKLILDKNMKEINAAPKIFHNSLLKLFNKMPTNSTLLDTYIVYKCLKNNIKIIEINVKFYKRINGTSKWKNNIINFLKHLSLNFFYLFKLKFSNVNYKT